MLPSEKKTILEIIFIGESDCVLKQAARKKGFIPIFQSLPKLENSKHSARAFQSLGCGNGVLYRATKKMVSFTHPGSVRYEETKHTRSVMLSD